MLTERALRATTEQHLERGAGALLWLNGRAMAALGNFDAGLGRMREGFALQRRHGQGYGLTRWYEGHGHACRQAGRHDEALASVEEGLALADASHEHASTAELHRLQGDLRADRGDRAGAADAYERARGVAAGQGALYLEIAVATAHCSLDAVGDAPHRALADLLARWADPWEPAAVIAGRAALAVQR